MLVKVTAGILILATVLGHRLWWSLDSAEPPTAPPSTRASDRGMPATAPAPAPHAVMPTPEFVNRWRASDTPDPAAGSAVPSISVRVRNAAVAPPDRYGRLGVTARAMSFDRSRLENAAIGGTIAIEVPDAPGPYRFVFDRRQRQGDRLLLSAHLAEADPAYGLIVTLGRDMQATLSTPSGSYSIESVNGIPWLTSQRELSLLVNVAEPDYRIPAIHREQVQ